MENVTLNLIYKELKKLNRNIKDLDKKIENFMGTFELSEEEIKELERVKASMKKERYSLEFK